MKLNEQIREHRKKAGLTQEQVANYLGISTPAVNKWESGSTYPDITFLPILARLLKIDLNTLFSFHEDLTDLEIKTFSSELVKAFQDNSYELAHNMAKEKIHQYPHCDQLLFSSAKTLDALLEVTSIEKGKKEEYDKEIINWYEQASTSQDMSIQISAISLLAQKYINRGNFDRARKLAEEVPDSSLDKQSFQVSISMQEGSFEEAAILMESKLLQDLQRLHSSLCTLIVIELNNDNHEAAEKIAETACSMISLFCLWPYLMHIPYLHIALFRKDAADSLIQIKRILEAAKKSADMKTSALYHRISHDTTTGKLMENTADYFITAFISELSNSNEYDFLRSNEDFQNIMAEYREMAAIS